MRTRPYKHKLNMLEPGWKLCKAAGIFLCAGVVCWLIGWPVLAVIGWSAAGVLLLLLFVLVAVELHQDRVMLELARREDQKAAKENHSNSTHGISGP